MIDNTTLSPESLIQTTEEPSESLVTMKLAFYWVCVILCFVMGMVSCFGNGLVLYISNKKEDFGGYRQVNWVVKNLALSDMLFGLVGCPLTIVLWTWGR